MRLSLILLSFIVNYVSAKATPNFLYSENDIVISVNNETFTEFVINKNYATLLQFYNSYCGHCKRFAPEYKKLAKDIQQWNKILKVMAINCADDENNPICREYEILMYPTLRYISPKFIPNDGKYGIKIENHTIEVIKSELISLIQKENNFPKWPDFTYLNNSKINQIFEDIADDVDYIFIVYEPLNKTIGAEIILNFSQYQKINVRRVNDLNVAKNYKLTDKKLVSAIDRNLIIEVLSLDNTNIETIKEAMTKFLNKKHIATVSERTEFTNYVTISPLQNKQNIIDEIKKNKNKIYQEDLEKALYYVIFNEITKRPNITDTRLLALQTFLKALNQYNPLNEKGQMLIKSLNEFVEKNNQIILGETLEEECKKLKKEYSPIFTTTGWIGCISTKPGLRGFTCGLWQLFHYMTIRSANDENQMISILDAIYGYVKHFFGCSECSNHFQEMAFRRKMKDVKDKDEAVLWLWAAHNEVNQRLAGDITEDPEFPKIQFPSKEICPSCYNNIDESNVWNKTEVLKFLKHIYNPNSISYFREKNISLKIPDAAKLMQLYDSRTQFNTIISDLDVKVGFLLYVFGAALMLVTVNLIMCKKYGRRIVVSSPLSKV